MKVCKYQRKYSKECIRCKRDGSLRKVKNCNKYKCPHIKPPLGIRFLLWLHDIKP